MTHALNDPIRHNSWATAQVLEFCRGLDEHTLNTTVPGTYGTILATLEHLIDCEMDFLYRLLGRESAYPWKPWQHGEPQLDVLTARAALLVPVWEEFLASDVDDERLLPPDEGDSPIPAGIIIAVVLYHGNEHRAHICTTLGALGHPPPDITPWAYAFANGRIRA
jgi:uncharacterized damage-inducible protein DinB